MFYNPMRCAAILYFWVPILLKPRVPPETLWYFVFLAYSQAPLFQNQVHMQFLVKDPMYRFCFTSQMFNWLSIDANAIRVPISHGVKNCSSIQYIFAVFVEPVVYFIFLSPILNLSLKVFNSNLSVRISLLLSFLYVFLVYRFCSICLFLSVVRHM